MSIMVEVKELVVKRNEQKVSFDPQKITDAIKNAGKASDEFGEEVAIKLTMRVLNIIHQMIVDRIPTVEEIQDIVEEVLLDSTYRKTAKGYIIYRDQHSRMREINTKFNVQLVDQYLKRMDWKVNENSNMSFSLQGLNNYISSEVSKTYWLNSIYPEDIREAHKSGDFHIHDLGLLSAYCVGWDLFDLLTIGFKGVAGKVESKPARHFRTALGQVVNFFYTLQGEAAGAQAFSNFDTLLAPFIRYDGLDKKGVKQALQEFMFNINVPTRVGFQTPFTNITLDLNAPSYYAKQGVIIGGEVQKETYGEFQDEMDMFNSAFLEIMAKGDAKGRVFTFPIPTYNISEDFDWENPNIEKLWEVTAKYGIPYFANFINSEMDPEDARSMCCRLRIDNRELRKRGGGLFGASPLTGSIGVVTINLPRIGYTANSKEEFFNQLAELMDKAKESLQIKRKILENYTDNDLYPYMKFYLRSVKERFNKYLKNHFSTIGIIGLNEASLNLFGENIASKAGKDFGEELMDFMRDRLLTYQKETGEIFNLEATPAEGTAYSLALLDKKRFKDIIHANEDPTAKPYYTNSSQLPVHYTDDIFELLDLQDSLQAKYTGGTVQHLFLGERVNDTNALKNMIRKICETYELPYFSITPTFSICPECGYLAGEQTTCPKCESKCEIYSRVVGYLRPVEQWNDGKKEEFTNRKMLKV